MKILLATDGSVDSKAMVEEFAGRIFAPGSSVKIISAYQRPSFMMNKAPMGTMSEYYEEIGDDSLKLAKQAIDDASITIRNKNPALSISKAALEGPAKKIILDEAETFGTDLIVIGSHGQGELVHFLLGSVSLAVALHAKCSVEIVRNQTKSALN